MPGPIGGINAALPLRLPESPAGANSAPPVSFQQLLIQSLNQVGDSAATAEQAVERSLLGDDLTMVESFSAVKQADLSLRLMLQVRNKLLDAYNEVKNLRM